MKGLKGLKGQDESGRDRPNLGSGSLGLLSTVEDLLVFLLGLHERILEVVGVYSLG